MAIYPKGSGKSAIHQLLLNKSLKQKQTQQNKNFVAFKGDVCYYMFTDNFQRTKKPANRFLRLGWSIDRL